MAKSLEKGGMDMKSEMIHYIRVGGVIRAEWELSITTFNCYKGDRDGLERSFSQRWRSWYDNRSMKIRCSLVS